MPIDTDVFEQYAPHAWEMASNHLHNGDLLLCSGDSMVSRLIRRATQSVFSHVALLLKMPVTDQWLVLESVETKGVRCVSLEDGYLRNYNGNGHAYPGKMMVARHCAVSSASHWLPAMYQKAFSLLGDHYDDKAIFEIAARIGMKDLGIHPNGRLQPGRSYICSEFVYACFQSLKIQLPFDANGFIAPADIANDAAVKPILQLTASNTVVEAEALV